MQFLPKKNIKGFQERFRFISGEKVLVCHRNSEKAIEMHLDQNNWITLQIYKYFI